MDIMFEDARKVTSNVDLSYIDGKTILITGASGLIGANIVCSVVEYVRNNNADIKLYLVIHRQLPDYLQDICKYPWIEIISGDLSDRSFIDILPQTDIIFHCAGYGQPGVFMKNADKTLKLNTMATFGLLDKLKPNGKFLFTSSSAVYTGCLNTPFKEDEIGNANTTHPRACYIEGKKCGEAIVNAYRQKGIDAKSVRLSITYGPGTRQGDARALNNFIEMSIKNKKLQLLDDGSAVKTYMYVSDAVELIWHILLNGTQPVYNIGSKCKITIRQIAEKVAERLQVPLILGEKSAVGVKGAILNEELCMDRCDNEFHKTSYVDIDEGLERTIDWNLKYMGND